MDILPAVQSVATAIGIVKELREIDRGIDAAEFKLKIADLATALAEAKMSLVDAQEALAAKDKEIARLTAAFEFQGETVEHHGFRYRANAEGKPMGMPFCPKCEAKDAFFMQITYALDGLKEGQCPNCKATYAEFREFPYPDGA